MALEALARLLAHQSKAAGTERAIQTAVRLLALDPLQEAVHRTLMRLYARQGRRGAALKQYQVCVGVLQRELGTEPEAETKQLYQELLRRPAEAVQAADARAGEPSRPARTRRRSRHPISPRRRRRCSGGRRNWGVCESCSTRPSRGHGHVATVVGEAGIGKTRLVSTLAADALARDAGS